MTRRAFGATLPGCGRCACCGWSSTGPRASPSCCSARQARHADGARCVPVFLRRPQADAVALGRRSGTDPVLPQDVAGPAAARARPHARRRRDHSSHRRCLRGGARLRRRHPHPGAAERRPGRGGARGLPITMAEEILDEVGQPVAELFPHGGAGRRRSRCKRDARLPRRRLAG